MKKTAFLATLLTIVIAVCTLAACAKQVNYLDYISESRFDVFLYKDDATEIKIQCLKKEQPFSADGYKGEVCDIAEIFVTLPKNPPTVEVSLEGYEGEMNYQAVERLYYLSFSAPAFKKSGVDVTLTFDGESKVFTALSVKDDSVMSCEKAVFMRSRLRKRTF